ncbi:MAG: hypothetical protein N2652_07905 [Kiritimatiellae bacterium]|nr:hypothetical protein [Kiritimatiellia bacterium]
MYRLRIRIRGRPRGRLIVSEPRVVIGSDASAELRWLNAALAPRHAELIEQDGIVAIRALSPDAPVTVAGRPVGNEAVIIPPDATVRLGALEIELVGAQAEPPRIERHRIGAMTAIAAAALSATLALQILVLNRAAIWSRKWRDDTVRPLREDPLERPPTSHRNAAHIVNTGAVSKRAMETGPRE